MEPPGRGAASASSWRCRSPRGPPALASADRRLRARSTRSARVSGTAVLLEGTVDPQRLATTYYFQYGATTAYGAQTAVGTLAASATATRRPGSVSPRRRSKKASTTAWSATNARGTNEGHDRVFTNKTQVAETRLRSCRGRSPRSRSGVRSSSAARSPEPSNGGREIALQASRVPLPRTVRRHRRARADERARPLLLPHRQPAREHAAPRGHARRAAGVTAGSITSHVAVRVVAARALQRPRRVRAPVRDGHAGRVGTRRVSSQLQKCPNGDAQQAGSPARPLRRNGAPTFAPVQDRRQEARTDAISRFSVIVDKSSTPAATGRTCSCRPARSCPGVAAPWCCTPRPQAKKKA